MGYFFVFYFKTQKNDKINENTVVKSVTENVKIGKEMLLKAFQNEDGKILADSKTDEILGVHIWPTAIHH